MPWAFAISFRRMQRFAHWENTGATAAEPTIKNSIIMLSYVIFFSTPCCVLFQYFQFNILIWYLYFDFLQACEAVTEGVQAQVGAAWRPEQFAGDDPGVSSLLSFFPSFLNFSSGSGRPFHGERKLAVVSYRSSGGICRPGCFFRFVVLLWIGASFGPRFWTGFEKLREKNYQHRFEKRCICLTERNNIFILEKNKTRN